MSSFRAGVTGLAMLAAFGVPAGAQDFFGMFCSLASTTTILQATDSNAELSDLVVRCTGSIVNTNSSFPLPTLNWTLNLPQPDPACGQYTAITIQIPFELSGTSPSARLVVSENGVPGSEFGLKPVADQVHVPNSCEAQANARLGCAPAPLVTHANGTLVNLFNPAKSGEELVVYAFGLGATTPPVPTGQATPAPATVKQPLQVNFDYRPNAAPSRSLTVPPECATLSACPQVQPAFAGLTPGFAGLYQVNFIVPAPPPGTPRCNAPALDPANPPSIASNLTVSIIAPNSFDGAAFCVDPSGT